LVALKARTTSSAPSFTPAAVRSTAIFFWTSHRSARRPRRRRRPWCPSPASACCNRRASSLPAVHRKTWPRLPRAALAETRSPKSRHRTDASACVASCRVSSTTTLLRSSTRATTRWSSMRALVALKQHLRSARRKAWKTRGSPLISGRRRRSTPSSSAFTHIPCRHRHHPYHNPLHLRLHLQQVHHCLHRIHRPRRSPRRPNANRQKASLRAGTCSSNAHTMAFAKMVAQGASRRYADGEPIGPTVHYAVSGMIGADLNTTVQIWTTTERFLTAMATAVSITMLLCVLKTMMTTTSPRLQCAVHAAEVTALHQPAPIWTMEEPLLILMETIAKHTHIHPVGA
jgi:hypothetical protein